MARLNQINDPKPSLHTTLITRLESSIQKVNTPAVGTVAQEETANLEIDGTWTIFDESSLGQIDFASWPYT